MKKSKDISNSQNNPNEKYKASVKAYAKGFAIGSLVGTAFGIVFNMNGVSTVFVFASLFGAIGYQLKMRSYERGK